MTSKKVLVLSYEEDPHADSVCNYLKSKDVDCFRVDTQKLIGQYQLSFSSLSGKYRIANSERTEEIDSSWSIWNRRIMEPTIPEDVPKDLHDIIITETKRTWDGLLHTHQGRIVNSPQTNFAANNKIDQLVYAKSQGMRIPDTLLTNNPIELRQFYGKHTSICHKLQKVALVERGGEHLVTYNNIVREDHLQHADLIRKNPSMFQEYIEKDYELRITVLEKKVVAVAIHSQAVEQSCMDFRKYDFENVPYARVDLPAPVEQFCLGMAQHYGLKFAEIDMIKSTAGEYVFLEVNPNGQWLWLELKSGYNLTKDVAENLL